MFSVIVFFILGIIAGKREYYSQKLPGYCNQCLDFGCTIIKHLLVRCKWKTKSNYIISPEFTGDIFFNPPILYMPNNAPPGTTQVSDSNYSFDMYGSTYHVEVTSTTIGLGLEDVVTENTVLRDCIKASNQITQYIQETEQTITGDTICYWFCKGIGVVKQVETGLSLTITGANINVIESSY